LEIFHSHPSIFPSRHFFSPWFLPPRAAGRAQRARRRPWRGTSALPLAAPPAPSPSHSSSRAPSLLLLLASGCSRESSSPWSASNRAPQRFPLLSMAWASSDPWRPPPLLLPQASRRLPLLPGHSAPFSPLGHGFLCFLLHGALNFQQRAFFPHCRPPLLQTEPQRRPAAMAPKLSAHISSLAQWEKLPWAPPPAASPCRRPEIAAAAPPLSPWPTLRAPAAAPPTPHGVLQQTPWSNPAMACDSVSSLLACCCAVPMVLARCSTKCAATPSSSCAVDSLFG
jgi:hypothetical protein